MGVRTRGYRSWETMKARCYNPNNNRFKYYGAKGVGVCDRWLNSSQAFLEDMGEPAPGQTLGRIDNSKDYSPENCRWENYTEQNNNRSTVRKLTHNGKTQSIAMWARDLGLSESCIRNRLNRAQMPVEAALSPVLYR